MIDETARGLVVREGGLAERAFGGHLAGLLRVSRTRALGMLHTATAIRGLPVSWGVFATGAFGWQAAEAIVHNRGTLTGSARDKYDLNPIALAVESVPQRLDSALSRLHDCLDPDAATDHAASAHRNRTAATSTCNATTTANSTGTPSGGGGRSVKKPALHIRRRTDTDSDGDGAAP